MKTCRKSAFSLIELIVVVAVMAVLAAAIIPSISGTREAASDQRAIAAAEALNLAQTRYRMEKGVSAWNAASGHSAKYLLLVPYLEYGDATLTAFQTNRLGSGYTIEFQNSNASGVMQKVVLKKGASTITY